MTYKELVVYSALETEDGKRGDAMLPIEVNEHTIGIVLKELVRRAIVVIRNERFSFEATVKQGYSGSMDDVFTSADTKAQAVFEKLIQETLPGVGLIGEEGLLIPCTIPGHDIYITIDPLDGTKAFVRRQSHGVSTMVALVMDGEVISAWVGDVNTLEIYGYRPGTDNVHRISQFEVSQRLNEIDRRVALHTQYILMRDASSIGHAAVARCALRFKSVHIDGSSIGTWFSRLWKGEYAAAVVDPGSETPWDSTPVIGISQKLGFIFMRPNAAGSFTQYKPALTKVVVPRKEQMLVVHESMAETFLL